MVSVLVGRGSGRRTGNNVRADEKNGKTSQKATTKTRARQESGRRKRSAKKEGETGKNTTKDKNEARVEGGKERKEDEAEQGEGENEEQRRKESMKKKKMHPGRVPPKFTCGSPSPLRKLISTWYLFLLERAGLQKKVPQTASRSPTPCMRAFWASFMSQTLRRCPNRDASEASATVRKPFDNSCGRRT